MGSDFHLFPLSPLNASKSQPFQGSLYVNGRAALRSLLLQHPKRTSRIWIPSYVCQDVYEVLAPQGDLQVYGDYPDESSPRFESLDVRRGDIILIQDGFGLSSTTQWAKWLSSTDDLITIEDISHNSTQERYLESPAKDVFSSIRKSLPIADGGIVFSKQGGLFQPQPVPNCGAHKKLEAMILKAMYLDGHNVDKQTFRTLQVQGEELLGKVNYGGSLAITEQLLAVLPHDEMRAAWSSNTIRLREYLKDSAFAPFLHPLSPRGENQGLFHLVIKCRDRFTRNRIKERLITHNIFPAVHWQQNHNAKDTKAVELSETLLTLPTDFRYDVDDIDRLASALETELTCE